MMRHVKAQPKIVDVDTVCMQSNVGQRCDWCLLSSLTTEMEIKVLLYTERLSKKGGPQMKLPPPACSGAYHRGSESAKQLLIKCCQQRLFIKPLFVL